MSTQINCDIWIYGPQVSDKNRSYGVGGETWWANYHRCTLNRNTLYTKIRPDDAYTALITFDLQSSLPVFLQKLKSCKKMDEVLLIHSAFINAHGLIEQLTSQHLKKERHDNLYSLYAPIYNMIEKMVHKDHLHIFVEPIVFGQLSDKSVKRPKNIRFDYATLEQMNDAIKITNSFFMHPINERQQQCAVSIKKDCSDIFANVQNELFKPLAKVISCQCSFLQKKISDTGTEYFKIAHQTGTIDRKPPILIRKVKNTYLSQLFEKTCILLYQPCEIIPESSSEIDVVRAVSQNLAILKHKCSCYAYGNLSVFETPIVTPASKFSNVPVYFIKDNTVYNSELPETSIEFFTAVLQELVDLKVFIPTENKERYILNSNFDIEELEAYKALPNATKTAALKKEVTDYFFLFIGNIFHFAVANNLKFPFKFSLAYLSYIFNIVDFSKTIEHKLLIISIYFFEKATAQFKTEMIKIFEDPKHLLTSPLFGMTAADRGTVGARMNGYMKIVPDVENIPIYSDDKESLVNNMITFMYKIALKEYFESNVLQFINGHTHTSNFGEVGRNYKMTKPPNLEERNFQTGLERLLKIDSYF